MKYSIIKGNIVLNLDTICHLLMCVYVCLAQLSFIYKIDWRYLSFVNDEWLCSNVLAGMSFAG